MEQPEVERRREPEKENVRLKRLLRERDVEVEVMKDLWKTKRAWPAVAGRRRASWKAVIAGKPGAIRGSCG
ncbi:MAG TPA: hypothetical protein VHQ47_16525 [Phycisphaerae bacterium]|nr:hypothetical protein [Phycisphaerae bacterium]